MFVLIAVFALCSTVMLIWTTTNQINGLLLERENAIISGGYGLAVNLFANCI